MLPLDPRELLRMLDDNQILATIEVRIDGRDEREHFVDGTFTACTRYPRGSYELLTILHTERRPDGSVPLPSAEPRHVLQSFVARGVSATVSRCVGSRLVPNPKFRRTPWRNGGGVIEVVDYWGEPRDVDVSLVDVEFREEATHVEETAADTIAIRLRDGATTVVKHALRRA